MIVVGAGIYDGEGERAHTVYNPIVCEEKYLICFKRFAGAKIGTGHFAERQFAETQFGEREGQFAKTYSAKCPCVNFRQSVFRQIVP